MKTSVLLLIVIMAVYIFPGCDKSTEPPAQADGTLTVKLTGADEANGKNAFFSVWPAGTDITTITAEDFDTVEGGGLITIENGSGESNVLDLNSFQPKKFNGGKKLDVHLFVDINESIDISQEFDPTSVAAMPGDKLTNPYAPNSVTIDGNKTVTISYADLITITNP
jgi:hypothetical protein